MVLIARFLLGFSQAVFYPGVIFVVSTWYVYMFSHRDFPQLGCSRYKCDELGLRMAYIICGSTIGASFGSLIESGIFATMDGKLGHPAWR